MELYELWQINCEEIYTEEEYEEEWQEYRIKMVV